MALSTSVKRLVAIAVSLACAGSALAGGALSQAKSPPVSIVLEGPNQWTTSGNNFGPAWAWLLSAFHKANPNIVVRTRVLPLGSFAAVEAAQLAAGTAPAIIFDQVAAKDYQLTPLDKWLHESNPFVPGNKEWIDLFKPKYYSYALDAPNGHMYELPLNLVILGLFYNKTAFQESGITSPPSTFQQFIVDLQKLKAHGYIPFGATNTYLLPNWNFVAILNQLLTPKFSAWNWYKPNGQPGKSPELTLEDICRAILTHQLTGSMPQVAETLRLMKEMAQYYPPGWSGIANTSGAGIDLPQFIQGKAAIIWGVNFGYGTILAAHPHFSVGTMAFPTVTKATTPLSVNAPATQGASIGGTTYYLPATDKGPVLNAAIRFLQFATAPKINQHWLQESSANSVIIGSRAPVALRGMLAGSWGDPMKFGYNLTPDSEFVQQLTQIAEGYMLGTYTLQQAEQQIESDWIAAAQYDVQQYPNWKGSWTGR